MENLPLVTIMIATKDRHEDLTFTLTDLRRQNYPNLELVVIDDASTPPIESIVRAAWPQAHLVRYEKNAGQAKRRNEGFELATGEYVLQLDDDCSPVAEDAIFRAVQALQADPQSAGVSFYIWNGLTLPEKLDTSAAKPGLCWSFIGAAVLFRKKAFLETSGYRPAYFGYAEEEEVSLQLLRQKWSQNYRPDILFHHRFSGQNRSIENNWKRALRNRLWTIFAHMPAQRIPLEAGWKVIDATWDAFRLFRVRAYLTALYEMFRGLPEVLRYRSPLDALSLRRYDMLRTHGVLTHEEFEHPVSKPFENLARWAKRWPNRLREGSRWSKSKAAGRGEVPTHEHELRK